MNEKLAAIKNLVEKDDVIAALLGSQIAEIFKLRKDSEHPKDRFQTTGGSKTFIGVARTLFRLIEEAGFDMAGGAGATGQLIADTFKLRKDPTHRKDRFQTTWGAKTVSGLTATAASIIEEAIKNLPEEFLIKSEKEYGFWSNDQGWVFDVESATKFNALEADQPQVYLGISDAKGILVSKATDFDPDSELSPN
jgi:hypothetical protein